MGSDKPTSTAVHSVCAKCGEALDGGSMLLTTDKKLYHIHCSPYAVLKAVPAVPVAVKALEWKTGLRNCQRATVALGFYEVEPQGERSFGLYVNYHAVKATFASLNEAKAAAQSDFEARFRACLASPQPLLPAGKAVEAMVETALAEWSKPNDRRDPIDIMRAALTAALSVPAPGTEAVNAFLRDNPLREDAPRYYGDLADEIGRKIEVLLSEERRGAFIGLHQVRAIKAIEAQIRAALTTGSKP